MCADLGAEETSDLSFMILISLNVDLVVLQAIEFSHSFGTLTKVFVLEYLRVQKKTSLLLPLSNTEWCTRRNPTGFLREQEEENNHCCFRE